VKSRLPSRPSPAPDTAQSSQNSEKNGGEAEAEQSTNALLTAFSNATPCTFFQPQVFIPASRPKKH